MVTIRGKGGEIVSEYRKMQKRHILWWMLLFLLICNTLVTMNINIAIVSMVNHHNVEIASSQPSSIVCPNTSFFLRDFFQSEENSSASKIENIGLNWTETEQNAALSGYYWLNYLSIMPGGVLSYKYGSKVVVGYAQLISSSMSSLIPLFAEYGATKVAWIRAIQGVLSFISVPAASYAIMGNWSPPDERGWFGTPYAVGSAAGMTLGSFVFGYVAQYVHWKYVFHLTTVCGLIWSVFWFTCIYDSPSKHPTITYEERKYIENSLKEAVAKTRTSIPWKGIMTSVALAVCILSCCAGTWAWVMLATYSPVYLNSYYGLNSNEIGIISSVANLVGGLLSVAGGYYCDVIIRKKILSMTHIRKLCTLSGNAISAIPLVLMVIVKCNLSVVLTCIMINSALRSVDMFGAGVVVMDLSPKFCGVLEGFSGTSQSIVTFVISAFITCLTGILDTETMWKVVFLGTAFLSISSTVLFLIYGTSDVQRWNFEGDSKKVEELRRISSEELED